MKLKDLSISDINLLMSGAIFDGPVTFPSGVILDPEDVRRLQQEFINH